MILQTSKNWVFPFLISHSVQIVPQSLMTKYMLIPLSKQQFNFQLLEGSNWVPYLSQSWYYQSERQYQIPWVEFLVSQDFPRLYAYMVDMSECVFVWVQFAWNSYGGQRAISVVSPCLPFFFFFEVGFLLLFTDKYISPANSWEFSCLHLLYCYSSTERQTCTTTSDFKGSSGDLS